LLEQQVHNALEIDVSLKNVKENSILKDWNNATSGQFNVTPEENGRMILPLVLQYLTPQVLIIYSFNSYIM